MEVKDKTSGLLDSGPLNLVRSGCKAELQGKVDCSALSSVLFIGLAEVDLH